jgi:hypothetical protein
MLSEIEYESTVSGRPRGQRKENLGHSLAWQQLPAILGHWTGIFASSCCLLFHVDQCGVDAEFTQYRLIDTRIEGGAQVVEQSPKMLVEFLSADHAEF